MKTLDGGWSWIVCGSAFIGHMMTSGFSLAIGVYFVEFLAVFNESKGTTAWVSALNFGAQCLVGRYCKCVQSLLFLKMPALTRVIITRNCWEMYLIN